MTLPDDPFNGGAVAPVPGVGRTSLSPEQTALLARLTSRNSADTGASTGERSARAALLRSGTSPERRSVLRHTVTVAVSFTLLLALSVGGLAGLLYAKYNGQLTRVAVLQQRDPNIRDAARQQGAANFLVLGSDSRAGADAGFGNVAGARSDTAMIVHLSPDHQKATIISIPRDSWVDIPACKASDGSTIVEHTDMFNSAFSIGGPTCAIATVQKLTGIAITHFVEIDFAGFQAMVDAIGTVTVCSPESVSDPGSGLVLHPGNNPLDGAQALAYVRARETLGDGSDLGRIKRQQMFLGDVLRQAMTGSTLANPARLTSFLDAATKAITIDQGTTFADLRELASSLQGLDPARVRFYTAPIANQNYTPPGTQMTGRVLLDAAKGRILYDSVINDQTPVWVTGAGTSQVVTPRPARSASPATSTPATSTIDQPVANLTAGDKTCSL